MKKTLVIAILLLANHLKAQIDSIPADYFVTHDRTELMQKFADLPCQIYTTDSVTIVLNKLGRYLKTYQPNPIYTDDKFALEAAKQALISVKEGGYGIGAVLVDEKNNIIAKGHNSQKQQMRTDLHGEMTLLTNFEAKGYNSKYRKGLGYKKGVTCFSSAEPCPMCLIRLATAGLDTKYCTVGPDDGMTNRIDCLPSSWGNLIRKMTFTKGNTSPELQKISHLLFFSYLFHYQNPYSIKPKSRKTY